MFRGSGIKTRPYRVDTFGKYLGAYIGPEGPTVSWGAPGTKYIKRVWHIKGRSLGICQNTIAYNSLAFSVLSFVGQLYQAPPAALKKRERSPPAFCIRSQAFHSSRYSEVPVGALFSPRPQRPPERNQSQHVSGRPKISMVLRSARKVCLAGGRGD
eukprot:5028079-Pyramimonas_sp.AAC.1